MNSSRKIIARSIVIAVAGIVAATSNSAAAQTVSSAHASSSKTVKNLDLSSSGKTVTASNSAVIREGASTFAIKPGDILTPAQYAALTQVLAGQSQNLHLDTAGRAIGGSFSLSLLPGIQLGSLVVPSQVTVMGAQNSNSLSLAGALLNNGNLLALPTNSSHTFILNAASIQNNLGANISTIVPQTFAMS